VVDELSVGVADVDDAETVSVVVVVIVEVVSIEEESTVVDPLVGDVDETDVICGGTDVAEGCVKSAATACTDNVTELKGADMLAMEDVVIVSADDDAVVTCVPFNFGFTFAFTMI